MSEILLVEDDPILGRSLTVNLGLEGHHAFWAKDLKSAREFIASKTIELVVLDLNLPDGNGLTLCKSLRDEGHKTPIIVLTARTHEDSVVEGLEAGANDYMRKPFSNRELMARIRTALRDSIKDSAQIRFGELVMDLGRRQSWIADKEIELRRREFDILKVLAEKAGMVISRDQLLSALGQDSEIYDRTIDSHVSRLRLRLRESNVHSIEISSVYGIGYRLEKK